MNYSVSLWDYHNNKLIDLKSSNISIKGEIHGARLKRNINGLKELNFILPLHYLDEDGQKVENFRWDYIQSESLVKLEFKNEYDWFIIKTFHEERSDNGSLLSNIQCKHISTLLSQSGLDLYVDEFGNAEELLKLILDGSGWTVGTVDIFRNKNDEIKIRNLKLDRSNRYNAIQNLAELFNGYPRFNPDKTVDLLENIGDNNGVVFRYGKNIKSIQRTVGENDIITKLWVEGGSDNVGLVTISDVNPTGENYILDFSYFINGGFLKPEQIQAIEDFENNIGPANEQIYGTLSNLTDMFNEQLSKESLLEGKFMTRSAKQQTLEEVELAIKTTTNTSEKNQLLQKKSELEGEINTLNSEMGILEGEISSLKSNISDNENNLSGYITTKENIIKNLNGKLSEFIREGLWQDANYVDDESLYEDGLKQSKSYAYPQVSYNMTILDLSELTGYEIEKFKLGDIIRIIDDNLKIDTVARITEEEIELDNPQNVIIQIGNYYSNFEDLFKKITQSAEIIKQRQEIYERAAGINPDGTINYDVLQATFDNNKFRVVNGTNNEVVYDKKGITVTDIADSDKKLRINAGGIFITTDGGETWKVGMSPDGISALNVTSGVIDTKLLQIWNSEQPRFKWSKDGLFAYSDDGYGNIDEDKYIKINEDGIFYTLNDGVTYLAKWTWNEISFGVDQGRRFVVHPDGSIEVPKITHNEVATDFGNSIDISANNSIVTRVEKGDLINQINISTEGILIDANKIDILGETNIKDASITTAKIQDASITTAKIGDAQITSAKIGHGAIESAHIGEAQIDTAHIKHGSINTAHIVDGAINDAKILEGSIGTAHISELSADLLTSGTIDTGAITIRDETGRMIIANNKLQVFDYTNDDIPVLYERIALGHLEGEKYGLVVRGSDGATILLNEDGITEKGFTDGYSKLPDNSLNPIKIDIDSVITRINEDGTSTIEGSKILLNNKTLDVEIFDINTKQSELETTTSNNTASITANTEAINLKLDSQTFDNYKTETDGEIDSIYTNLQTKTTEISALQGQIVLKAEQSDLEALETITNGISSDVDTLQTQYSGITIELGSIDTRVGNVETEITTLDGVVTSHDTRLTSAEQKITDSAIVNTVRSSTLYSQDLSSVENSAKTYTDEQLDDIDFTVGVRNLILNSNLEIDIADMEVITTGTTGTFELLKGNRTDKTISQFNNFIGVQYNLSRNIEKDEWYTFSIDGEFTDTIAIWVGGLFVGFLDDDEIIFKPNINITDKTLIIKSYNQTGTINTVKLAKENIATDWSPAPEDIEDELGDIATRVVATESNIIQLSDSINERITKKVYEDDMDGISEKIESIESEFTRTAEDWDLKFSKATDNNRVKNSVGLAGTDYWEINGDVATIQNEELEAMGTMSAFYLQEGIMSQTINTLVEETYNISLLIKSDNPDTDSRIEVEIIDIENEQLIEQEIINLDEIDDGYNSLDIIFNASSINTDIKIKTVNGSAFVTAIMLISGDSPRQWVPNVHEMYSTNFRWDDRGFRVRALEENREIGYTVMTPYEFEGYYDNIRTFAVNKDQFEMNSAKVDKQIVLGNYVIKAMGNGIGILPIIE